MPFGLGLGFRGLGVAGLGTGQLEAPPTLDLRLAADKRFTVDPANPGGCLITSRRGPDAAFSRASGGMFTDSDGLVKWGAENLLLNSAVLATQSKTLDATPYTLSFYGTGTVTLSGGHVAAVVGTGSTRKTYTFTPTAGSTTFTVTGSVTKGQLNRGTTPCQYLETTSAPVYGPRFDHDPLTGECLGLLNEPQRTNLVYPSEGTPEPTAPLSPNGVSRMARSVTSKQDPIAIPGGTSNKRLSLSVWLAGSGTIRLKSSQGFVGDNFSPLIALSATPTLHVLTVNNAADFGDGNQYIGVLTAEHLQADGATATQFDWYGYKLTEGDQSSYIPTTSAPVVRSADVEDVTIADMATEGTMVVEFTNYGANLVTNIGDGTNDNRIEFYMAGALLHLSVDRGGARTFADTVIANIAVGESHKLGISWNASGISYCVDGGSVTASAALPPAVMTKHYVGGNHAGSSGPGVYARDTLYPKALPSKLQSLTQL